MPQLFPIVGISLKTPKFLLAWAQISHFLVTSQMRSKNALTLLHQPLAVRVSVCLVTKISQYTQRLLSILQSLSPPSYMTARHGFNTVVIAGNWSFHIRRLQLILGLRWWHKVTHSEIRSRSGISSIESMLIHRQLRCLGHVIRMPDSRLPHHVLYGQLRQGHTSVGRQKKCFKGHIKSILKKCHIPFNRLEAFASNRANITKTEDGQNHLNFMAV